MESNGVPTPFLVDAPAFQECGFSLSLDRLRHDGGEVDLNVARPGWLRRYAPSSWGIGTVSGSLESVTKRAFLTLVGAISRLGRTNWLTQLDALLAAEDRLLQLQSARALNIRVPETVVTSDPVEARDLLGDGFIVKPLSMGYYEASDGPKAVYTSSLTAPDLEKVDFGRAPFMAQERIDVQCHWRVVTVGDQAWSAMLSAQGRPLDWRQQEAAHSEWEPGGDSRILTQATQLAAGMHVRYSSQDWVVDDNGPAFLDFNPGGQWMFLPPAVSQPVTCAIARFLGGG